MNQTFLISDLQLHADLADLLELLSISLTNPTRELAGALVDGSYFSDLLDCADGVSSQLCKTSLDALRKDIVSCAQSFSEQDTEALYHAINQEFTRLFISPRHEQMPLYESLIVHRGDKKTSMFINPTCMHCEQEYAKHGFPFPEKSKTPGDHVAIELRYMAYLISRRISVLTAQNETGRKAVDLLIQNFTNAHLKRWLHPFMDELAHVSAHPFYQMIANAGLTIESLLIS